MRPTHVWFTVRGLSQVSLRSHLPQGRLSSPQLVTQDAQGCEWTVCPMGLRMGSAALPNSTQSPRPSVLCHVFTMPDFSWVHFINWWFYQIGRNVKITNEFSPESRAKEGGRLFNVHRASHSDHTPCTCRRWLATLYLSVSIAPAQLERVAHLLAPLMPWKVDIHITIVVLQRGAASYPKLYPRLLTSSRVLHPIVPPFFLGCQTWPCEHRHHLVSGVPEDLSGLPRCPLRCGPPPALHLCPTAVTCVVCYIPEVKSLSW